MRIEYANTPSDIFLFNARHSFFSLFLQICFGAISGIVFASYAKSGLVWAGLVLAIALYVGGWLVQFSYLAVLAFLRPDKSATCKHILELSDSGIVEESEYNRSLHKWSDQIHAVFGRNYIWVYVAPRHGHVVPNRAFSSLDQKAEFFRELKCRIANSAV